MAIPSTHSGIDADADTPADDTDHHGGISVHSTCPGRHVLVEDGNTDAWIATDCIVPLER